MGGYVSTNDTWFVYRRSFETDTWINEALQTWEGVTVGVALSHFKHEAYAFSLGKYDYKEDTKCIYLYKGNDRVAKVLYDRETEQIIVWSSMIREWIKCEESLPKLRYPIQQANFFRTFHTKFAWVNSQTITFVKKDK